MSILVGIDKIHRLSIELIQRLRRKEHDSTTDSIPASTGGQTAERTDEDITIALLAAGFAALAHIDVVPSS